MFLTFRPVVAQLVLFYKLSHHVSRMKLDTGMHKYSYIKNKSFFQKVKLKDIF